MDISLFRSVARQYEHLRQVNTVSMMNVISQTIENQIIQHQMPLDFYVGFQRFSHFPDQLRRYARLGRTCRRVYVFGVADYPPPSVPGIEFIEISPTSALASEWFLLVNTPDFWATLVSQEMDGQDPVTGGRQFDGFWSYDELVIERLSLLISQIMEMPYQPLQQRNYHRQSDHISEISNRMLELLEKSERMSQRRWVQLCTTQKLAELCSGCSSNLLRDAARILHTILGASGVVIALSTSDTEYTVSAIDGDAIGKEWKMSVAEGMIGRAIQQRRIIQINDVELGHDHDVLLPSARSLIAVPIANRHIYGVIAIGHTDPNHWSSDEGETLCTCAKILASKIEQEIRLPENPSPSLLDMNLSLDPSLRFEQFMFEHQRNVAYLLALYRKLRVLGNLTPSHVRILSHIETAYKKLVKSTKEAKQLLHQQRSLNSKAEAKSTTIQP
ncbi:MAG: DICT sensory domain-containing protein [Elainellaceae cyanobacterium]